MLYKQTHFDQEHVLLGKIVMSEIPHIHTLSKTQHKLCEYGLITANKLLEENYEQKSRPDKTIATVWPKRYF